MAALTGEISNVDINERVLMDKQPVLEHWVVHDVRIVVEAVEFKVSKHGRPLEKKSCGFRPFFVVGYTKKCERCSAPFLAASVVQLTSVSSICL